PLDRGATRARGARAVREGLAFVRRQPQLRLIVGSTAVVALVGFNVRVLIPVLTSKTLHAGPRVLGLLFACFGLGALAGAERPRWRTQLGGLAGLGAAMVALGLLASTWADAALLALTGLCFTLWSTTSQSMLQLIAP